MLVFGTQMHVVTFVFLVLEVFLLFYQIGHYWVYRQDRTRFYYLILLALLIFYNLCGGLFPDPKIGVSIAVQNMLAYGSGFLMASYFPYFFYRGFHLYKLRFHALYGVPLFLLMPYVVFFVVFYWVSRNLELAIRYGMIIPFVYSIVIAMAMLNAIRVGFDRDRNDGRQISRMEMVGVYCAVLPWVSMTAFSYFHVSQWVEVFCTNLGFVLITVIFIVRSIRRTRIRLQQLREQALVPSQEVFEENLLKYGFTAREMEIIRLIRQGKSYQDMADMLFIAQTTVARHVQNIHGKAEVKSRLGLMRKLEVRDI
ncbi:response regulator transcription factor [Pedobacter sp. UC225_61]|uniref:response regulator transcription factor n=1 Tax=Pedobacter sp. UC225_61 TaxID=3374623 RepID=UPI00379414FC